ncbi:MAG: bifunctional diaminohydroxyphosphoribosylaminopyrimidine deaminase/5-amino-6-(5-phosphoribosylamino)uracil reductase RibD [Phycisphaerales bacterium]|nr:bifunctional diaminohydroxyphosphoribosylaminopyrimidine deaminase/5-amino-6-(5-phosphoribosylamino)uracil reductase RibD [Phycisphaerales bacterium]
MQIALAEALLGRGAVEPNPMVGAVIARGDAELARGRHERFGGPHAEPNAISAARRAGVDITGATMYVTLEPCDHQGKTPPCSRGIIDAGIGRVVVAMVDPDQQVSGAGIRTLRDAGVQVDVGVCEAQAREMLRAYCKLRTTGRPWVICKWAQTSDGYLALPPERGRWISCPESLTRLHEIRSWCDGILVGISTVLADNPMLTDRSGAPRRKPLSRIVLDSHARLPADCKLVASAAEAPVIVAAIEGGGALAAQGAELMALPARDGRVDIEALLDELGRRQYTYLLVEGGAKVLGSFIDSGLADELMVFISPQIAGDPSLPAFDIAKLTDRISLGDPIETRIGADTLLSYRFCVS